MYALLTLMLFCHAALASYSEKNGWMNDPYSPLGSKRLKVPTPEPLPHTLTQRANQTPNLQQVSSQSNPARPNSFVPAISEQEFSPVAIAHNEGVTTELVNLNEFVKQFIQPDGRIFFKSKSFEKLLSIIKSKEMVAQDRNTKSIDSCNIYDNLIKFIDYTLLFEGISEQDRWVLGKKYISYQVGLKNVWGQMASLANDPMQKNQCNFTAFHAAKTGFDKAREFRLFKDMGTCFLNLIHSFKFQSFANKSNLKNELDIRSKQLIPDCFTSFPQNYAWVMRTEDRERINSLLNQKKPSQTHPQSPVLC